MDLCTYPSIHASIVLSIHASIDLATHPHPSMHLSTYPFIHPSIVTSNYPSLHPSIAPAIIPSIHPASQPTSQPSIHPASQPASQPACRPAILPTQSIYPSIHSFQLQMHCRDLSIILSRCFATNTIKTTLLTIVLERRSILCHYSVVYCIEGYNMPGVLNN